MTLRLDWIDKWTVHKYRDTSDTDEQWEFKKSFMLAHCESYPVERLLYWTQIFCNIIYRECTYPAPIMTQVEKLSRTVFTSQHSILQKKFYRLLKSSETKSHTETSKDTSICDIEESQQSRDTFKDSTQSLAKKDQSSPFKQNIGAGNWDEFSIPNNEDSHIKKDVVPQDSSSIKDNSQNSVLDTALFSIYGEEGYLHDDDDDDDYYLTPNLKCSPSPTPTPISPQNSDNSRMYHGYKNVEKGSPVSDYDGKKYSQEYDDSTRTMRDSDLTPEEHRQSRNKSPISDYDKMKSTRLYDGQYQSRSPVSDYERKRSRRMQNLDIESTSNVLDMVKDGGINPDHFDCESISSRRQSKSPSPIKYSFNHQQETSNHDRENTSKIYDEDDGNIFNRVLDNDLSTIECEFSQKRVDKSPETKRVSYPMLSKLSLDILSKMNTYKKKSDRLYKENDNNTFPLGLDDKEDTSLKTNYNEKISDSSYKKEDKHTSRAQDRDSPRHGHCNRKDKSPDRYYDRNRSRKLDDNDDDRRKKDDSTLRDRRDSSKSKRLDDDNDRRKKDYSSRKSPVSRHDRRSSSKSCDEERRRKQNRDSSTNLKYNHQSSREQKSPASKYDRGFKPNQERSTHSRRHSNSDSDRDEKNSRRKILDKDSESHRDSSRVRKCEERPEKPEALRLNKPEMYQATRDSTNHANAQESGWSGGGTSMNFYQPQPNFHQLQPNFHQPLPNFHQYQPNYHYNQHSGGSMNWDHPMPHSQKLTLEQRAIVKLNNNSLIEIKTSNDESKEKKESRIVRIVRTSESEISPSSTPSQVQKTNSHTLQRKTASSAPTEVQKPDKNCKPAPSKHQNAISKVLPEIKAAISSSSIPTQVQKSNNQTLPSKTASSAIRQVQRSDAASSKAAPSRTQNAISKIPSPSKAAISSSSITTQEKKTKNEDLSNKIASAAPTQVQETDVSGEAVPCKPSVAPNANSKVNNNTVNSVVDASGEVSNAPRIKGPETQVSSGEASSGTLSNAAIPQENLFFISQVLSRFSAGQMNINSCPNVLGMLANPRAPSIPLVATGLNLISQMAMMNQSNQISQLQAILSCGRIPRNSNPPVQGMTPNAPVPSRLDSNIQKGTSPKVSQVNNTSKTKKKSNTKMSSCYVPSSSTSHKKKKTTSGQAPTTYVASNKPTLTVPPYNNKRKLADALGKAPECVITLDDDTSSAKIPKLTTSRLSGEVDWKTALPKESVRFYAEAKIRPCLKTVEEITLEDIRQRTGPLSSVAILCLKEEPETDTLKRLNFLMDKIKLEVVPTQAASFWSCRVDAHDTRTNKTQVICEAQAKKKFQAIKAVCSRVLWYLQHIYFTFLIKDVGNPEPSDIKSEDFVLLRFCQNGLRHTMPADFLDNSDTCLDVPFTTDNDIDTYSAAIYEYAESFTSGSDLLKFLHFSPKISDGTTRNLIGLARNLDLQVRWKTDENSGLVVYRVTTKMYWNFFKVLFDKFTPTCFSFDLLRPHETSTKYEHSYAFFLK